MCYLSNNAQQEHESNGVIDFFDIVARVLPEVTLTLFLSVALSIIYQYHYFYQ